MYEELNFEPEPFEGFQVFDEVQSRFFRSPIEASPVGRNARNYMRWVQCSLNQILGSLLVIDGIKGPKTTAAIKNFQQSRGLKVDGIVGPITEAALIAAGAAPVPTTSTPPKVVPPPTLPSLRPCCMLAGFSGNILDPANLGTHGSASEKNGLVYTGGAGFFDLGHVRDVVDMTKLALDQITAGSGYPQSIKTFHGSAAMCTNADPANWVAIAKAIAFDDAFGHEIITYTSMTPGGHNSSFSPEDLVSNFLGTVIAERAIKAGGTFNTAVTTAIDAVLALLTPQTPAESTKAFNRVNGRWIDFTNIFSLRNDDYLKRRNFTRTPFKTGHPSDTATPAFVVASIGGGEKFYSYTHSLGRTIPKATFPAEVSAIKADAAVRYRANFDKP